jgi:hypothetical protein
VELINVDFEKVILDTQPCSGPSIYDQLDPLREDSDSYREVSRKALSFIFCIVESLARTQGRRAIREKILGTH